jgi:hypothetical protein
MKRPRIPSKPMPEFSSKTPKWLDSKVQVKENRPGERALEKFNLMFKRA